MTDNDPNAQQTWRVELLDGSTRDVRITCAEASPNHPRVFFVWRGDVMLRKEFLSERPAVAYCAADAEWPVISILAPGQPTRDEALSVLEVRVSGGNATPEEKVAYLRERLTREETWSHRATQALALRVAREHGRTSPTGDDILAAVDETTALDALTSGVDTMAEREAAAFKRGAEAMREACSAECERRATWEETHDNQTGDVMGHSVGALRGAAASILVLPLPEDEAARASPHGPVEVIVMSADAPDRALTAWPVREGWHACPPVSASQPVYATPRDAALAHAGTLGLKTYDAKESPR